MEVHAVSTVLSKKVITREMYDAAELTHWFFR